MSDSGPRVDVVSKSLIRKSLRPGITKEQSKNYCLGIPEWCPCCMESNSKQGAKSLQLKRPRREQKSDKNGKRSKEVDQENHEVASKADERFSFDTTANELDAFKEGECPLNTTKNTEWALKNFEEWRVARNRNYTSEQCPPEVLKSQDFEEVCDWLCKFVAETRKADGTQYTPRSLKMLLMGIQRHLRKLHPKVEISLFSDSVFRPLKMFVILCLSVYTVAG